MKNFKVLFTLIVLFFVGSVNAQVTCVVTVNPLDTTVCPGDSAFITASANLLGAGQSFDFNNSAIPTGWNVSGGSAFATPCGANPTNTPYYWASTSSGIPGISTAAFDVSCGGVITFDMVYAIQGGSSPCEGPDEQDEGVSLQYSIDGGITWIDIVYYSPGGFELPTNPLVGGGILPTGNITPYTSWSSFTVTIPPGALTTGTMFQWTQSATSGTCCDNWGLDNIIINATGPPCGSNTVINWSNGLMDTTSFYATPVGDTTFVAYVYDTLGNYQCESDTIHLGLFTGNFTYNLPSTAFAYCDFDSAFVEVTNIQNAGMPMTYTWSNGDTTGSTYLNAVGTVPDTLMYYVDMVDACGTTASDSVELLVQQTLTITGFNTQDQINCGLTGSATAFPAGNIGAVNYAWTGPGSTGTYTANTQTISGIPTGWYHVTITDNVCNYSDSVFVDSIVQPISFTVPATVGVYCPNDSTIAQVTNPVNTWGTLSYSWSNGDTTASSYLAATSSAPDTITYYVTVTDQCGISATDSVDLTVVQYLNIPGFTVTDQVNCTPNGAAQINAPFGSIGATTFEWTDSLGNIVSTTNPMTGVSTGWYYVTLTDNVCSVSDSVFIDSLSIDNLGYDLVDTVTVFCPFDSAYAEVTNLTNAVTPMTYSWSTGDTTAGAYLHAGANKHDTILYFVDFTDACGFSRSDSVVLVVNQLLTIDSLIMSPTTSCQGDGMVEAFYSGTTGTVNLQWETQQNWNNPGSGDSVDFNPWLMIGGGWHYFTVSDDICQEFDSIQVEVLDPPVASFTASPADGCAGMSVTLTNNSQNTTQFYWDFGNGNDTLVNNMGSFNQTYWNSGQVMLIAYLDATQTCSDTAYLDISVVTCGCTDPLADNYNPLAVVDDGSCFYPLPEVIAPNVFTPNGDNNNDVYFFTTKNTVLFELIIMNRWGNVMYETTLDAIDLQNNAGWDGTAPSGNEAKEGTYFYKYTATGVNGDKTSGEGFLQLVRD